MPEYDVRRDDYIMTTQETYYGEAEILPAGSLGVVKYFDISSQVLTAHFDLKDKSMIVMTTMPGGYWEPVRGMLCDVYTSEPHSYPWDSVTVVSDRLANGSWYTANIMRPPMWVIEDKGPKPMRLCSNPKPRGDVRIGAFVWTSDSRFRQQVSEHPLPIYEEGHI